MDVALTWFSENYVNIAAIYGALVAVASVVVKLTPTTTDDAVLGKVQDIVGWFAAHQKSVAEKPLDISKVPTEKIQK